MVLKNLFILLFFINISFAQTQVTTKATKQIAKTATVESVPVPAPMPIPQKKSKPILFDIGYSFNHYNYNAQIQSSAYGNNKLKTTISGFNISAKANFPISDYYLTSELGYFSGRLDAQSTSSNYTYFKRDIIVTMPSLSLGFMSPVSFAPNEPVFLGVNLFAGQQSMAWAQPKSGSGTWQIQPSKELVYALQVFGEYHYKRFYVFNKIGYSPSITSIIWNLGFAYQF